MKLLICIAHFSREIQAVSRARSDSNFGSVRLVVLWEASDRICGKGLKALLPLLIESMERNGHMGLAPEIRAKLLAVSASTIDRALGKIRQEGGRQRRRPVASAL